MSRHPMQGDLPDQERDPKNLVIELRMHEAPGKGTAVGTRVPGQLVGYCYVPVFEFMAGLGLKKMDVLYYASPEPMQVDLPEG